MWCARFPSIKSASAPSYLRGASLPATAYTTGHIIKITGKEKFREWNFFLRARVERVSQDEKKSLWFRRTNGFLTWKHNLRIITTGVHLCHSYINSEGIFEQKKCFLLYLWSCLGRLWFLSSGHNSVGIFSVSCYSAEWCFFRAKHYEVSGWFIAFDALITSFQLCLCLISNESKPFKCMSTANEHV